MTLQSGRLPNHPLIHQEHFGDIATHMNETLGNAEEWAKAALHVEFVSPGGGSAQPQLQFECPI